MTLSGVYSQKSSTSSEVKKFITAKERDSIFRKIQRGKADALKVKALKKALVECGKTKDVYVEIINVHKMKSDSLLLIIQKQENIEASLVEVNRLQVKEQGKKSMNSFLRGSIVGIILTTVAIGILAH